jgi:hypothetical protein
MISLHQSFFLKTISGNLSVYDFVGYNWEAQGLISNSECVQGIEYLINQKIIKIKQLKILKLLNAQQSHQI